MKNVLVIGSRDNGSKNDTIVIQKSLASAGFEVVHTYWEDIVFDISTAGQHIYANGQEFDNTFDIALTFNWYKDNELLLYRDIALTFGLWAHDHGITCWNSEVTQQRSITKLSCMQRLAAKEIPVPPTLFSLNPELLYEAVITKFEFPVVAKAIKASRGEDNHLIQTAQELRELLHVTPNKFCVQPFLPNDHDLRIICFGDIPQLALKRSRQSTDTHMNNTSQGGDAQWLPLAELDIQLLTEAENIAKIMGAEMAGIDFIPDQSSPYGYACLEVNSIPQLTSGTDVDTKMQALIVALNYLNI